MKDFTLFNESFEKRLHAARAAWSRAPRILMPSAQAKRTLRDGRVAGLPPKKDAKVPLVTRR